MNGDEHEIVAALYGPSEYRTEINGTKVCITEDTSYPFSGKITFRFALDGAPVRIPFTMRIPSWVENAKLTVNAEQPKEYHAGGFSTIERRFKDGDVVELDIDMKPRAEKRTDAGINVYMGPLLYSVDIDENVEIIKDQFKTSVAFPAYNVTPASKWNFGLPENPKITVVNTGKKGFPWTPDSTPVKLKVTAFEIPEWRLLGDTTPGLPEEKIQVSSECEEIEMVPSGCTRIRMTTLPVVEYCK
ncbi:MAG: hypothetical protein ACLVEU_17955 [Bacteroides cellulosilyticus]